MPSTIKEIAAYSNEILQINRFQDYCPNGLQVEGRRKVKRLISGVTACQALLDAAVADHADAVLVHHGYFWKGERPELTGMKARRLRTLLTQNISLLAYHLPLDAHPEFGNNTQLARLLRLNIEGYLDRTDERALVPCGTLQNGAQSVEQFRAQLAAALSREPLWIAGQAPQIERLAWCTGAAQDFIHYAVDRHVDAFISGEISERTKHIATEEGIHYFAAGHHATERYGVQALGQYLAERFSLQHRFIDIDNPV